MVATMIRNLAYDSKPTDSPATPENVVQRIEGIRDRLAADGTKIMSITPRPDGGWVRVTVRPNVSGICLQRIADATGWELLCIVPRIQGSSALLDVYFQPPL